MIKAIICVIHFTRRQLIMMLLTKQSQQIFSIKKLENHGIPDVN